MLNKLSILLLEKNNINFDPNNQHLAHIINLAAKKALENLYEFNIDDFNALEKNQETEETEEVESNKLSIIYKVNVTIILKI
jgi:hypothetical protein